MFWFKHVSSAECYYVAYQNFYDLEMAASKRPKSKFASSKDRTVPKMSRGNQLKGKTKSHKSSKKFNLDINYSVVRYIINVFKN